MNDNSNVSARSCFRCGNEFHTSDRERVCWRCRKPKNAPGQHANKDLTFREQQVADLVAQGKANKDIAFQLLLTEGTIKEYLNRIFRKVEVSNRTELALWVLARRTPRQNNLYESRPALEKRSLVI